MTYFKDIQFSCKMYLKALKEKLEDLFNTCFENTAAPAQKSTHLFILFARTVLVKITLAGQSSTSKLLDTGKNAEFCKARVYKIEVILYVAVSAYV